MPWLFLLFTCTPANTKSEVEAEAEVHIMTTREKSARENKLDEKMGSLAFFLDSNTNVSSSKVTSISPLHSNAKTPQTSTLLSPYYPITFTYHSKPKLALHSPQYKPPLLLIHKLIYIFRPSCTILLQVIHTIAYYIQFLGAFAELS